MLRKALPAVKRKAVCLVTAAAVLYLREKEIAPQPKGNPEELLEGHQWPGQETKKKEVET